MPSFRFVLAEILHGLAVAIFLHRNAESHSLKCQEWHGKLQVLTSYIARFARNKIIGEPSALNFTLLAASMPSTACPDGSVSELVEARNVRILACLVRS